MTTTNVISENFKSVAQLVEPEKLKLNSKFIRIASHIYFMFYHPYQHSSEPISPHNILEQQEQKQIDNSSSTFFKEFDSEKNWNKIIFGGNSSSDISKSVRKTLKEFSYTENSSDPSNVTYSMALRNYLNTNLKVSSALSTNRLDTPSDIYLKVHSCLYDSNGEKMMCEISDLIDDSVNSKGEKNFGFGVDVLRLFAASLDQSKILIKSGHCGTLAVTVTSEMFQSKQREIKLFRQVYEECFKITQDYSEMFDPCSYIEDDYSSFGNLNNNQKLY